MLTLLLGRLDAGQALLPVVLALVLVEGVEEAQQEVVGALNLVINLVVRWNTVYLQQVVQTLRAEGVQVRDEDLARLSPVRYEHINRLGRYTFPSQVEVEPNGLCSL